MKTDWKDDIFKGEHRIYSITDAPDGNKYIEDVTPYTQQGDAFGALELGAIGKEVNRIQAMKSVTLTAARWSSAAPYTQTVSVTGMTANDLPVPLLDVSKATNWANEKLLRKNYGYISYYDTAEGSITFTAKHMKPTLDLTIGLKGVD